MSMAIATAMNRMRSLESMDRRLYAEGLPKDAAQRIARMRMPRSNASGNSPQGEVTFNDYSRILGPDGRPFQRRVSLPIYGGDGAYESAPAYHRKTGGGAPDSKKRAHPWIGDLSKFWPILGYSFKKRVATVLKSYTENVPGKFWKVTTGVIDSMVKKYDKEVENAWNAFLPKVAGLLDMWEGPTNLGSVYVVDLPGTNIEIPVYFQKIGDKLPSDMTEVLRNAIRDVKREEESPYNDQDLADYFRGAYSEPGAQVQTWEDVPYRCVDPTRPKKWMVREGSEIYSQKGPLLESLQIDVDGQTYKVRRMGKSSGWDNLGHFIPYWVAYGAMNLMGWKLVKDGLEKASPEFLQWGIETQMKAVYNIVRPFTEVPGRPVYEFDLKNAA